MNTSPAPGSLAAYLSETLESSLTGELPAVGTPRTLRQGISPPNKATPVIGVRRGGKTTCLHQLRRERLKAGRARECLPYLSFDDPRLAGTGVRHLHTLIQDFYSRHPALKQTTVTWCFDEIEAVPGWERFIRSLMESEKVEVFVAGSFASLMPPSTRTAPGSTGEIVVHPLGFEEYLRFHAQAVPAKPTAAQQTAIESRFAEYLERGGFPAVQRLAPIERERLLADTLDLALLRDVLEKRPGTSIAVARMALEQLLGSPAIAFGADKLSLALKTHGHGLPQQGAQQLMQYLEDAFLVRTVPVESTSSATLQRYQPRKIYPVDPSLVGLFERARTSVGTAAVETVVLLELERRGLEVTCVSLPGGREVDFMARSAGGAQELIQVCSAKQDFGSLERALQSLRDAERLFPHATRRLLTVTRADIPASLPVGMFAQPAYEWLLDRGG